MPLAESEPFENELLVRITQNYREEAQTAKRDRMEINKRNFDVYHLKQDYSHKMAGQSREFLSKQSMAVEQISSFFQQGLVDIGEWYGVEKENGIKKTFLDEDEVKVLLGRQLEASDIFTTVHDLIKLGLLGSLMILKIHGEKVSKPVFKAERKLSGFRFKEQLIRKDRKIWRNKFSLIRQEDYFPDPTGRGLYQMHDVYLDLSDLYQMSEGKDAIYDRAVIDQLQAFGENVENDKMKKSRETGQNSVSTDFRKRIKVTECWGNILDPTSGKLLYENVTWTVANDQWVISRPRENPFWHGLPPFVVCPIIRVPHSVWHKALMDSPTRTNIALNELYNLIVDSGMMATHGIKQVRTDALEDQTQISNGIAPGTTLAVTGALPHGAKVLERIDTASMSQESLAVFQLMNAEFQQSALTNDLRMGVLPSRQVKATEVVEASQTITSVFTGIAKQIEEKMIVPSLEMTWLNTLQHMDDLDADDVISEIGKERALELAALSPERRFAELAIGHKFRVFGISRTLDKVKDYRKITSLLQTLAGSPLLMESFMKRYEVDKLLSEIMKSLDIDVKRLEMSEEEKMLEMALQGGASGGAGGAPGGPVQGPNMQSQIHPVQNGPLNPSIQSLVPQAHWPASPVSNLGKNG